MKIFILGLFLAFLTFNLIVSKDTDPSQINLVLLKSFPKEEDIYGLKTPQKISIGVDGNYYILDQMQHVKRHITLRGLSAYIFTSFEYKKEHVGMW